jgi:apolipoprotein N-acyltransferase
MMAADDASTGTSPRSVDLEAVLMRPLERTLIAVLSAVVATSLLAILAALLLFADGPHNPLRLLRLVTGFCLLPALAVWLLRWALAGVVRVNAGTLVIEQRQRTLEIALRDIVAVEPWTLPLPIGGLWVRLRSGSRLGVGVQAADPTALIEALADAGTPAAVLDGARHPSMLFAQAKHAAGVATPLGLLLKFPVFALVPTLPLFRVHQLIAYGGVFGEYRQYGLRAYLLAFAVYWATLTVYLMLYAAALRVPVEAASLAAASFAPRHASRVRRVTEKLAAVLFFAGVPIFVILRFIPW